MTNNEKFKNVAKLLNPDRRYTYDEIAYELDMSRVGISHSDYLFANEEDRHSLGTPHALRNVKHQCVKIACSLLESYDEEGNEMLQRIVAIDETWIQSFELELKQQSSE